ncbi:YqjF family protein [Natrialbaceae archaeon A-arb3/5]
MSTQRTDPFRWTVRGRPNSFAPHVASMTWRHGLFAHWPVDPDELRPHVPQQLQLETRNGRAWMSVLPFVLTNAGIRGTPQIARTAFPELNVRTYVRYRGDPGLFFFSIDVGHAPIAAILGRTTRLPVYNARMHVGSDESQVAFSSTRTGTSTRETPGRFAVTYRPNGPARTADPDTLEYWLTERRRFYAPENGRVLAGEIAHDPWQLQPAELTIHENTLFEANGLPTPSGEPVVHYCDDLEMTGSIPRWL